MHYTQESKALIIIMAYSTDQALTQQTHAILKGVVKTNSQCADIQTRRLSGQKKCIVNLEFKSICLTGSEKFCTITERKNEGERLFRDVLPLQ